VPPPAEPALAAATEAPLFALLAASPLGGSMRGACHCISVPAPKAGRQINRSGSRKARMGKDKRG
jgi:hypothetical protein